MAPTKKRKGKKLLANDKDGDRARPVGPAAGFRLPEGWEVEERPRRSNPCIVDRYYYEPGTGLQFRSLQSVQKYLNGEIYQPRSRNFASPGERKKIVPFVKSCPVPELPDGWIVEHIPRSNINYAGQIDKSYVEPGTGKRFRSLKSAQEHLAKQRWILTTWKPSKPRNQPTRRRYKCKMASLELVLKRSSQVERDHEPSNGTKQDSRYTVSVRNKLPSQFERDHEPSNGTKQESRYTPSTSSGPRRQLCFKEVKSSTLDPCSVPAKVKWVLNGPTGTAWTVFMGDSVVSESEKQKWCEAFVSTLQHGV